MFENVRFVKALVNGISELHTKHAFQPVNTLTSQLDYRKSSELK